MGIARPPQSGFLIKGSFVPGIEKKKIVTKENIFFLGFEPKTEFFTTLQEVLSIFNL
jgi:hypothetical protein